MAKLKKYELIEVSPNEEGNEHGLPYRIKSKRNFADVRIGDLGGFVESEYNLSQDGDCWIYDNSAAFENGSVHGNAKVRTNSSVYEHAKVNDNVLVDGNNHIHGNTILKDDVEVIGNCDLKCKEVSGSVELNGKVTLKEYVGVYCNVKIFGDVTVESYVEIQDKVIIKETIAPIHIPSRAFLCSNAVVEHDTDVFLFYRPWSPYGNRTTTYTRSNDLWVLDNRPDTRCRSCDLVYPDVSPVLEEEWESFKLFRKIVRLDYSSFREEKTIKRKNFNPFAGILRALR